MQAVRLLAVVVPLLITLAGCIEEADSRPAMEPEVGEEPPQNMSSPAPAAPVTRPEPGWVRHDLMLDQCETATTFFLVDFESASDWLPPGFHPADLSRFVEYTPAASGATTMHVASISCGSNNLADEPYQMGMMGFFVMPPVVPEVDGDADLDFYNLAFFTDQPFLQDFLGSAGWEWHQAALDQQITASEAPMAGGPPAPSRVAAGISDVSLGPMGDPWFQATMAAAYPLSFEEPPTIRFWHQTDWGIGFMEYTLKDRTFPASPSATCEIDEAGPFFEVLGRTDCQTTSDTNLPFGVVFPEHSLDGFLLDLPGVYPE